MSEQISPQDNSRKKFLAGDDCREYVGPTFGPFYMVGEEQEQNATDSPKESKSSTVKPRPGDIFRVAPAETSETSPGIKANWKDKRTVIDPDSVFILVNGKEISLQEFLRSANK